jgi:hypothetical protein
MVIINTEKLTMVLSALKPTVDPATTVAVLVALAVLFS